MGKEKLPVLVFLILGLIVSGAAFESDRGGSSGPPSSDGQCWNGADDDIDGNTPPSENPDRGPYLPGEAEYDPGCVNPYWEDQNEGMIHDTHFTATMEGLSPNNGLYNRGDENFNVDETESLFFSNSVAIGSESNLVTSESDSSVSSTEKSLKYVDAQRTESESDPAYGFGFLESQVISVGDFSQYTSEDDGTTQEVYFSESENRFIDTPHDLSSVCGNGIEDLGNEENKIDNDPLGNEKGYTGGDTIDCRGDYGRLLLKYDMDGNEDDVEHNYGNEDLECNDDNGNAQTTDEDYGSCGGCEGSSDPGGASCGGDKQDYTDSEGTKYYENPGDLIQEYECTRDETCNDGSGSSYHVSNNCDNSDSYTYIDSCESGDCGSCGNKTSYSTDGYDTQYCGQGHLRSWSGAPDSINCDDSYSVVDGGSRISDNRLGNDPAATYTKFTSYADNTWTDADNDGAHGDDTPASWVDGSGKVWAGYDFAATLNADGPRGNGDGFIVINERVGSNSDDPDRVVGRESPNGEGLVGKNVHYGVREAGGTDGSANNVLDHDMIDKVDLSCSGDYQICIKYVDFWTDGPGGDGTPGDPTWTISPSNVNNPSKSEVSDAISVDTEEYTLDESYSVCKAANRIAKKNPQSVSTSIDWSSGDNLVDCDYKRDSGGEHLDVSPLPEACGDESQEHLMVMEGPAVDSSTSEDWLGHEQKCVDWSSDGDEDANDASRELTRSACVNQGKAYAEGTVMNVASERSSENVYPYTEEGWESGGDSPDLEVCLDLQEDNGRYTDSEMAPKPSNYRHDDKSNEYYGGQWYDLDDPRINRYLQDMEDSGESWTPDKLDSIDSEEAGQSGQELDFIDYYYTENPNPYHEDYNPFGEGSPNGNRGTSVLADCGPGIECGDSSGEERSEVNSQSSGDETYFAFSNPGENAFAKWSREEDYHPQGRWSRTYNDDLGLDYSITSEKPESSRQSYSPNLIDAKPDFTGYIVKAKSSSDQLDQSHPDFDYLDLSSSSDEDWWYDTNADEDSAVQYAYAEGPDWGVDSTGVPYPPGGQSYSTGYVNEGDAEAGNYRHIDAENSPRTMIVDDSINKTDKAHGNSILVVASDTNPDYDEGQAYWINPDDITSQWEQDHIDRAYW